MVVNDTRQYIQNPLQSDTPSHYKSESDYAETWKLITKYWNSSTLFYFLILSSCLATLFPSSWRGKSAFKSVRMLNVKSVSNESEFQLALSHPYFIVLQFLTNTPKFKQFLATWNERLAQLTEWNIHTTACHLVFDFLLVGPAQSIEAVNVSNVLHTSSSPETVEVKQFGICFTKWHKTILALPASIIPKNYRKLTKNLPKSR